MASDMIERIQFNRFNVAAYHGIDTAAPTPCGQSATAQPMARGDCLQWQTMLNNSGLTGMTGTVVLTPIPPAADPLNLNRTTVQVSVRWTGGMATSTGQGLTKLSRPKSVTLTTVIARE